MPCRLIHNNTLILSGNQVVVEIITTGAFLDNRVDRIGLPIVYLRTNAPIPNGHLFIGPDNFYPVHNNLIMIIT